MYKYFDVFGIKIQNEHNVDKEYRDNRGESARQSFNEIYDMCINIQDEMKLEGSPSIEDKEWEHLVHGFAFLSACNVENVKRKLMKDL